METIIDKLENDGYEITKTWDKRLGGTINSTLCIVLDIRDQQHTRDEIYTIFYKFSEDKSWKNMRCYSYVEVKDALEYFGAVRTINIK